jgi:hypothetical protein
MPRSMRIVFALAVGRVARVDSVEKQGRNGQAIVGQLSPIVGCNRPTLHLLPLGCNQTKAHSGNVADAELGVGANAMLDKC